MLKSTCLKQIPWDQCQWLVMFWRCVLNVAGTKNVALFLVSFQHGHICRQMDTYAKGRAQSFSSLHSNWHAGIKWNKVGETWINIGVLRIFRRFRAFKHTSAQRFDFNHRLLPHLKKQSEDCLYMNIYVPERLEISRDNYLPVMVIVHGEEYGWGTGNAFNGTTLAAYGHIIVVTLNYRLGVFGEFWYSGWQYNWVLFAGFLGRCESSSCSGNSGISDLVSALTMLNVILPSFGGDSKSVTLAGLFFFWKRSDKNWITA